MEKYRIFIGILCIICGLIIAFFAVSELLDGATIYIAGIMKMYKPTLEKIIDYAIYSGAALGLLIFIVNIGAWLISAVAFVILGLFILGNKKSKVLIFFPIVQIICAVLCLLGSLVRVGYVFVDYMGAPLSFLSWIYEYFVEYVVEYGPMGILYVFLGLSEILIAADAGELLFAFAELSGFILLLVSFLTAIKAQRSGNRKLSLRLGIIAVGIIIGAVFVSAICEFFAWLFGFIFAYAGETYYISWINIILRLLPSEITMAKDYDYYASLIYVIMDLGYMIMAYAIIPEVMTAAYICVVDWFTKPILKSEKLRGNSVKAE